MRIYWFIVIYYIFNSCLAFAITPEDARIKLSQLNITYKKESFFNSIKDGDIVVVKLFLTSGMSPNSKDFEGYTPLMYASIEGNTAIVNELIKYGANVNDVNEKSSSTDALFDAARRGNSGVIKILLEQGADVNARYGNWGSNLICAARDGYKPIIVKELLQSGANVNDTDDDGTTPLIWASIKGHIQIVEELISFGADINKKNKNGWTALIGAANEGHKSIVKALIAKGAKLNEKANDGRTALFCAQLKGNLEIFNLLKEAGAE